MVEISKKAWKQNSGEKDVKSLKKGKQDRWRAYRKSLRMALLISCMTLAGLGIWSVYERIPRSIKLKVGEEQVLRMGLPVEGEIRKIETGEEAVAAGEQDPSNIPAGSIHIDLSDTVTMRADALSSYRMDLKLFGIIPFKQVDIEVIRDKLVTPVGVPVGIYLKTDGILVVGVGDFISLSGREVSPAKYLLKSGDYILSVDGKAVEDKAGFTRMIEESGGYPVVLSIRRDGEEFTVEVQPVQNQSGSYKVGIWVRDNAQGVGTLTFVDSEGNFGALGHGINDVDTSIVMEVKGGTLYGTDIIAIKKGRRGEPGEMTGMIEYEDSNILGVIDDNTAQGVFGTCDEAFFSRITGEPIPIGLKQEVETGPAQILCAVDGEPRYYDIVIKECHLDHGNVNRGIELQVTDPELIALTGGIIQGMSGAPIIQNGKLVGAVTHVLVNDSTSGYGIFIEEMLETETEKSVG